jgi:hypothetical protein
MPWHHMLVQCLQLIPQHILVLGNCSDVNAVHILQGVPSLCDLAWMLMLTHSPLL